MMCLGSLLLVHGLSGEELVLLIRKALKHDLQMTVEFHKCHHPIKQLFSY